MPGMDFAPSLPIFMAAESKVGGKKPASGSASATHKNWIVDPV